VTAAEAEAIRYAVEDLRTPRAFGAHLEVGDERFDRLIGLHDADQAGNREQEARTARLAI